MHNHYITICGCENSSHFGYFWILYGIASVTWLLLASVFHHFETSWCPSHFGLEDDLSWIWAQLKKQSLWFQVGWVLSYLQYNDRPYPIEFLNIQIIFYHEFGLYILHKHLHPY